MGTLALDGLDRTRGNTVLNGHESAQMLQQRPPFHSHEFKYVDFVILLEQRTEVDKDRHTLTQQARGTRLPVALCRWPASDNHV